MFFKTKCASCEELKFELQRQSERNLAVLERTKELEAESEKLRQELSAEREEKKELLKASSPPRDQLSQLNRGDAFRTQEETIQPVATKTQLFNDKLKGRKRRLRKVRKPSKASIVTALNYICYKESFPLRRILMDGQSAVSVEGISESDKVEILNFIVTHASDVAEKSRYAGASEDFGAALSHDDRTWQQLVKTHIPAIKKSINKEREEKEYNLIKWRQLQPKLVEAIEQNKASLLSNLRRALKVDEYGSVEIDNRDDEIHRFLNSIRLLSASHAAGIRRVQGYIKSWAKREDKKISISSPLPTTGIDFEYWIADRLREYGWMATVSRGSGDQGVDVIAAKEGLRVAIQCKLYSGSVGNKAVQETIAGMSFYDLDRGAVVSTGKFTRSARDLAQKNKILLLSVEDLPHLSDLL